MKVAIQNNDKPVSVEVANKLRHLLENADIEINQINPDILNVSYKNLTLPTTN